MPENAFVAVVFITYKLSEYCYFNINIKFHRISKLVREFSDKFPYLLYVKIQKLNSSSLKLNQTTLILNYERTYKKNDLNTACNLIKGVDKPTPSARLLPIKMAIYNNRLDCIKLIAIISGK